MSLSDYGDDFPSEGSSETGLFGQITPELDDMSSLGLSSPELGILEETSLRLHSPLQLFESWGNLDDDMEMYKHLRSPSIDNLDFEEEDDQNGNEGSPKDCLNVTVIPANRKCQYRLSITVIP